MLLASPDAGSRPIIELEAVRGRLPSAAPASSSRGHMALLQGAVHTLDAVRRVPLDRWDADWLLSEAGSR